MQTKPETKIKVKADQTLALALSETRALYIAHIRSWLAKRVSDLYAKMEAAGWDANVVAPRPDSFRTGKTEYRTGEAYNVFVRHWTGSVPAPFSIRQSKTDIRCPHPELDAKLSAEAEARGGAEFDGYVIKLSGKIGKPVQAVLSLSGALWNGSTLEVLTTDGEQQTWHTKVIINASIYHKLFNQWPTRRVV